MLTQHVALVSESEAVPASLASSIAAAVQEQVTRDFAPLWDLSATVNYFPTLEDVPSGYWPVIILDQLPNSSDGGYHTDQSGQPYALVLSDGRVSVDVSHECLEMLADPFGRRLVAGDSIMSGQGRVEYLVEVCDPCQGPSFSYLINGLPVSDFYTPHFFDPEPAPGIRYCYTGAITQPRHILKQGYISWLEPVANQMWQAFNFGPKLTFKNLGSPPPTASLREWVDSQAAAEILTLQGRRLPAGRCTVQATHARSSRARAAALREEIRGVFLQKECARS
jgi:hypothetical protein